MVCPAQSGTEPVDLCRLHCRNLRVGWRLEGGSCTRLEGVAGLALGPGLRFAISARNARFNGIRRSDRGFRICPARSAANCQVWSTEVKSYGAILAIGW